MNDLSLSSPRFLAGTPRPRGLDMLARRKVLARLEHIKHGRIVLHESDRRRVLGDRRLSAEPAVDITVLDPRFYSDVAFGGAIGAAEAYIRGYWETDNLTDVVRLLLRNREVLENLETGLARLTRPLQKSFHWLNRNSQKGSRRNISAHYDLGNDFFALWLDQRMMYSSAYFEQPDASLEDAATAKLDRICRKLQLSDRDQVLEIGTGWGGFAIYAASHYGCHITTTTISRNQYELARERITALGLQDKVTLLLKDYRELEGRFDKLVSIEMIEAVGSQYFAKYFETCCRLLKPNGMMCLQSITIADQRYATTLKSVDFIQRYVFPGGCLPSLTVIANTLTSVTDMRIVHCEDIGPHYAKTLRHWRARFTAQKKAVRQMGYPKEFLRLWHYYLCYCEGAFTERATGTVQLLLARPGNRDLPWQS